MHNGLLILVCCLSIAVAILILICRFLQMMEARKFHSTDTEELGYGNFVGHSDAAATTAGGYVLIPPHHHRGANKPANGSEKEKKMAPGMDPRDPDAWKRHDSQTDSFAERKDDPWKCDAPKPPSTTAAVGVAVAAPVAVVAGTGGKHDGTTHSELPGAGAVVAGTGADGVPVPNEKLVDGTEIGEDTVDAAVAGEVSANPLISMATIDDKSTAATLEPKVTVVPLGREDPVPAPAPAFSTVGFWEAQEAAHNAAKYGDGGGGGYSSNYGNDASSGFGYGDSGGRGNGDSSYGAGSYGYGSESTGGGDGSSGIGDLTNDSGI